MVPDARIEAVVFDLDGVLVDTEHVWDEVREQLVADWGGRYGPDAHPDVAAEGGIDIDRAVA